MGALGQAMDLVFRMKAEGADAAVSEINKVPKAVQKADDAVKDVATTSDKGSSSVSKLSNAFESLTPLASSAGTALGVLAAGTVAVVYGFTQIISAASKAGAAIHGATIQTGLSAQTLTTLGYNAQLAGQSLEQVLDPVKEFTRLIGEAGNGSVEAVEKMKRLGLEPAEALLDLDKALTQTLKKLGEMPPSVTKMNLAMDAFGEQGVVVLRLLDRFGGDLDKAREEAERLGITLSNDAAKGAADFDRELTTVQAQLTALTYQFGREFLPIIGAGLQQLSGWLAKNKGAVSNWATNISDSVRGVVEAIRFLQGTITATENIFAGFFGSTLNGAIAWAGRMILNVFDPIGSAIARIIEGFRQIGAERRKAEGTAEGSAGIERTVFGDASGSATGGIGGGGKVGTGGTGRGGGGGRARGGGGGGAATKVDAVAEQAKADALELQKHKDQLAELAAADKKDLADRKISKELYDQLQRANDAQAIAYELELLEKRSKIASATVEQKAKMNADIATLQSQLRIAQTEADAEAADSEKTASEEREQRAIKYADLIKRLTAERVQSEQELQDKRAETERKQLESDVKNAQAAVKYAANQKELEAAHNDLLTALIVLREFDIARLKEAQRLADQKAEDEAAAAKKKLEDDKLTEQQLADAIVEIDKKKKNKLLENQEQFLAGKAIIDEKYGEQSAVPVTPGEDPKRKKANFKDFFGALNEKPESGEDQFAQVRDASGALEELEALGVGAMQRMGAALGSAIEQWALYGGSVGQALKKALAAELAYIAGVATINAIYATALGFMRLAQWDFVGAGNAFISAGIWAAVAGGSALAARALSGGGKSTQNQAYDFRSNTIDSNNSSRAAGNTTQMLSESRTQRQDQRITLEVTSRDSHIVRVVGDNLNQRGDLFPVVVRLVEQN